MRYSIYEKENKFLLASRSAELRNPLVRMYRSPSFYVGGRKSNILSAVGVVGRVTFLKTFVRGKYAKSLGTWKTVASSGRKRLRLRGQTFGKNLGTRDAPFPRAHIYFRCRALLYKNWLSELVVLQRLHFLVHKCISDDTINIIECLHRSCSELTSLRAVKRAIIA